MDKILGTKQALPRFNHFMFLLPIIALNTIVHCLSWGIGPLDFAFDLGRYYSGGSVSSGSSG